MAATRFKGPVPEAITVEEASQAPIQRVALLSSLKGEIGDLDKVTASSSSPLSSTPTRIQPRLGGQRVLGPVDGSLRRARPPFAFGHRVAGLGLDICCEIEMIVEVADSGAGR